MKILLVALRYHQGNERGQDSFEYSNFYNALRTMDRGKHEAMFFPFDVIMKKKGKIMMNKTLLAQVTNNRPDVCFFSLIEDEIEPATLQHIQKLGSATLGWFGDDEWRFSTHSRRYAPYFSFVATTYPESLQHYQKIGCSNVIVTAAGISASALLKLPVKKDIDVSFVGAWSKLRERVLRSVQEQGFRVVIYGHNWPQGAVSHETMLDIIARSKIGLGLNPSSFVVGWRPLARLFFKRSDFSRSLASIRPDFLNFFNNFYSWRQKKIVQMKARTFEIPARRTLLLTQETPQLNRYYIPGKEIITYYNTSDLIEKIKYFLDHEEEREAVTEAGYQRTASDHLYEKRFSDLFACMGFKS